jgi:hypothetical protein
MKLRILSISFLFLASVVAALAQQKDPPPQEPLQTPLSTQTQVSDTMYYPDPLTNPADTNFVIPQTLISLNLAGITTDFVNLNFFHALGPSSAVGAFGGLIYRPLGAEIVTGSFVGVAYHVHPGHKALWRFFYGPTLSYHWFRLSSASSSGVAAGGQLGWQWFPYGNIATGLSLGGYYVFGGSGVENGILRRMYGVRPAFSFDLGFAW